MGPTARSVLGSWRCLGSKQGGEQPRLLECVERKRGIRDSVGCIVWCECVLTTFSAGTRHSPSSLVSRHRVRILTSDREDPQASQAQASARFPSQHGQSPAQERPRPGPRAPTATHLGTLTPLHSCSSAAGRLAPLTPQTAFGSLRCRGAMFRGAAAAACILSYHPVALGATAHP